ncbi:MAG TPA: hypothetical protein VEV39_12165, partial [Gemmatimonadales bacterium]|nr:hypothetical protein [Gemmatimonadales bacterium]
MRAAGGADDRRPRRYADDAVDCTESKALRDGRIIDSAARAGLPTRPLVEKALEGSAKGASVDAIATAVRSLAQALGTARQALGPSPRPPWPSLRPWPSTAGGPRSPREGPCSSSR